MKVRNRFKRLDLIDRVPDEQWIEVHDIVQETGSKIFAKKKNCKKAKTAICYTNSGEDKSCEKIKDLQIAVRR